MSLDRSFSVRVGGTQLWKKNVNKTNTTRAECENSERVSLFSFLNISRIVLRHSEAHLVDTCCTLKNDNNYISADGIFHLSAESFVHLAKYPKIAIRVQHTLQQFKHTLIT